MATDGELKYLWFIRLIVIQAIAWELEMYEWGKQQSGSFKSLIVWEEKAAILLLTPVYNQLRGLAHRFLVYCDNKVDEAMKLLGEIGIVMLEKAMKRLEPLSKRAMQEVQIQIQEAITSGVVSAIHWAVSTLMQLFPNLVDTISKFSGGFNDVPILFPSLLNNKPSLVPAFPDTVPVPNLVSSALENVSGQVSSVFDNVHSLVSSTLENVHAPVPSVVDKVPSLVPSTLDKRVPSPVSPVLDNVPSLVPFTLDNKLPNLVSSALDSVAPATLDKKVPSLVPSVLDNVSSLVTLVPGNMFK